MFSAIEASLLGGGDQRLAARAGLAGWTPDAPDTYCPRCGGSVGPHEVQGQACGSMPAAVDVQPAAVVRDRLATKASCAACRVTAPLWHAAFRLGTYDGFLADAVRQVKYRADRRLGVECGVLLGRAVADSAALDCQPGGGAGDDASGGAESHTPRPAASAPSIALVPVPSTHRRRLLRNRGVDHTGAIVEGVHRGLVTAGAHAAVVVALGRHHRPSQTGLSVSRRKRNVKDAFYAVESGRRRLAELRPDAVLLIDDIRTTGATLEACIRVLSGLAGAVGAGRKRSIAVGTLAVTEDASRRPERP